MIDVNTLTNSMPVAMFGMFALWAATSKRHWFVRTAVVAGAILVTLLIPAYEVVIMLTLETTVVVASLTIWRRLRCSRDATPAISTSTPFRLRVSMETLMLCVVNIAVVTTLAARWPVLRPESWYQFALSGAHSGIIALACVWLVCGLAPWWFRLAAALPLVFLLSLALICLRWVGNIVSYWFRSRNQDIGEYLQMARRDIWPATLSWMSTVALGMAILCAWLVLMKRAGWFDPFCDAARGLAIRRNKIIARATAFILIGIVAIFPLILFYKLLTPTPIPVVKLPNPNGYDDFLAAGRMIIPADANILGSSNPLTLSQLRAEVAKQSATFDRANAGLQKPCWNPYGSRVLTNEDSRALLQLLDALRAQGDLARQVGDLKLELANFKTLLRIAQEECRGTGTEYYNTVFNQYEGEAYTGIWNCATKLPARECADLVLEIRQIERSRDPWESRRKRQRIFDENSGWERHLQAILADWSGRELHHWQSNFEHHHVAHLRMLIIKLALRAYELDHNRLPASLSELVPDYLPAVPKDPFGKGPIQYRLSGDTYLLYSFGPDRDDDNGKPLVEEKGDLTDTELFPPPQPGVPQTSGSPASR